MDVLQQQIESLNKKEREEFEAAKRRGYLIDRSRKRNNLYNAYMTWCDLTTTPSISIRRGYVQFFFLSGSAHLSNQGLEEIRALARHYCFLPAGLDPGEWIYSNSADFFGVIPDEREAFARDLFLAVRKYGALDKSMKDLCPPLPFNHSVSAWVKDQSIPRGWLQISNSQRCY